MASATSAGGADPAVGGRLGCGQRLAFLLAGLSGIQAVATLLLWRSDGLRGLLLPESAPMAPSAALLVLAVAVALVFELLRPGSRGAAWGRYAASGLVSVVVSALWLSHLLGQLPQWELWLIGDAMRPRGTDILRYAMGGAEIGHMVPLTGGILVLAAVTLACIRRHGGRRWPQALGLSAALLGTCLTIIPLLAYAAGAPLIDGCGIFDSPIPTAGVLLCVNLGFLAAADGGRWLCRLISGSTAERELPLSLRDRLFLAGVGALMATMLVLGMFYMHVRMRAQRGVVAEELRAVVGLKLAQVVQWRRERLGDAEVFSKTPGLVERLQAISGPLPDGGRRNELQQWMRQCRSSYGYGRIALLDENGRVLIEEPERAAGERLDDAARPVLKGAASQVVELPPYVDAAGRLAIDLLAPACNAQGSPVGWLLLQADPERSLMPIIRGWPTPRPSAECLLWWKDGGILRRLNGHEKADAVPPDPVRLPAQGRGFAENVLGAARNARGELDSVIEAVDWRGVPSIGIGRWVPDSDWLLIAKLDRRELDNLMRAEARWISVSVATLLLLAGLGMIAVWSRRSQLEEHRRLVAELAQRRLETRLGLVMRYANDVILILDEQLRVIEVSDRAVGLYGVPREELLRRTIRDFRTPDSLLLLEHDLAKAKATGGAVFETVHRGPGGRPIQVECSVNWVELEGRHHLLAVIRDITERVRLTEDLKRSEERYRLITENSFDMIWLADLATGKFTYVSPASRRVRGVAPEELVGRPITAYLTDEAKLRMATDFPARLAAFNAGNQQARHATDELELTAQDGTARQIEVSTTIMPDAAGLATTLLGVTRDISERKRSEAALRESEERYRLIAENTSDTIWLYDLATGKFTYVSPAAERLFGYSPETLHGLDLVQLLSPASATVAVRTLRERIEALAAGDDRARHSTSHYEFVRRDGATIVCEVVTSILCESRRGRAVTLLGVTRDISERVETERQLLESEARYRQLFEQNPAPMFIYARGTLRLLAVNEAFILHYGYAREAALALRLTDLYPPEEKRQIEELARTLHGHAYAGEWHHILANGTRITIVVYSHDIEFAGAAARIAVVTDISERKRAESALRESEARFRAIAEASSDVIWLYDFDTDRYIYVSPAVEAFLGLTPEEVCACRLFDFLTPESQVTVRRQVEAQVSAFSLGDPHARTRIYEADFRRKDGETVHAEVAASLMADGTGRAISMAGMTRDITQRKRMEAALRESEHTLSAVFDNASLGIAYMGHDGRIRRANSGLCQMLGYTEDELRAIDNRTLCPAEDFERQQGLIVEVGNGRRPGFEIETRYQRRDGTLFWAQLGVSAVRSDAGDMDGLVVVVDDITERRNAREALEQISAELERRVAERTVELASRNREIEGLLGSIPDVVLLCGHGGAIVFSHLPQPESRPMFLASGEAWTEDPFVREIVGTMQTAVRGDTTTLVREFDRKTNDHVCSVEARATLIAEDQVLILLRDITARRRAEGEVLANLERERQLSELKSQFISVASHEFRTPLAAAAGTLELLKHHGERLADEKRAELMTRIERSLGRLTAIMNDVLTISRIDAGRVAVKPTALGLCRFVQDVVHDIEAGDRQQHRFSFESTGGPDLVSTDINLLHHILSNLLSNAVRYSPAGTTVRVALRHEERAFVLTVADEGIGVPEAERKRIFEPFVRGSNVGQIGGTGLGLNIVRRYVELLGGTVELLSCERGATFQITVPRGTPPPPEPAAP